MNNNINLVDKNWNRIGEIDKLEAPIQGRLHEAFSIFIFNENKELLIQRRAFEKYHSGGLWTNTCCSHPRVWEDIEKATHRRLVEEMWFDSEFKKVFSFCYKAEWLANNLIENEFDTVFVWYVFEKDIIIIPNPEEVCEYKWIKIDDLIEEIKNNPELFTEWLKIILNESKFIEII
jgi:isopentenyl-diphosphate delta-isomerase